MWVFTIDGFYSAVQDRGDSAWLIVRSRTEGDARRLADWLDLNAEPSAFGKDTGFDSVTRTPDADYGWRITVRKDAWGQYLVAATEAIDYPNFKNAVGRRQGYDRAHVYGEVWVDLLELQHPRGSA